MRPSSLRPKEARTLAQRALDVLDDAGADEPQLRCRALLALGEGAAMVAQDVVAAREQLLEAAELARNHGWADYAARASMAYGWVFTPGATDTRARELALSALELGVSGAWRPALLTSVAANELSEGDYAIGVADLEEARAAVDDPTCRSWRAVAVAQGTASFLQGMPDAAGQHAAASELEAAALGSAARCGSASPTSFGQRRRCGSATARSTNAGSIVACAVPGQVRRTRTSR